MFERTVNRTPNMLITNGFVRNAERVCYRLYGQEGVTTKLAKRVIKIIRAYIRIRYLITHNVDD